MGIFDSTCPLFTTVTISTGDEPMKMKESKPQKPAKPTLVSLEARMRNLNDNLSYYARRLSDLERIETERQEKQVARAEERSRIIKAILIVSAIITIFWVGRASAEPLCPFGCENLKPQTPPSCFESFAKPECENTKIDPGNDREEWKYLSEGYPQQVIALGNFEQSAWEEVEFQMARKRYWRFRALRCERGE